MNDGNSLDYVGQLAHVARPWVSLEYRHCFRRPCGWSLSRPLEVEQREVMHQRWYVALTVAKGRQSDRNHGQSKEQVLPESAVPHGATKVVISRSIYHDLDPAVAV